MRHTVMFPCDRGVPNNPSRGWHHFEAGLYGKVVCTYCGRQPAASGTEPVIRPPQPPNGTLPELAARVPRWPSGREALRRRLEES